MRLCLVEDLAVAGLEPLTLTRPVYDLLLGSTTLGAKVARAVGVGPGPQRRGAVVRPYLATVQQARDPHTAINNRDWLARGPVVVANGRWVPPAGFDVPSDSGEWLALCDGVPACALVGPELAVALEPHGVDAWFERVADRLGGQELGGEWIHRPWDLVAKNADHVVRDFRAGGQVGVSNRHLATAAIVGPADRLFIHESARIDPYTVFDTTSGPITIAAGAVIQPFTRVEGPSYVGRDTQLFRANLRGGVTIGPQCRIGGEVEASVVHGYSNKYHEGFLGHAYIGEWVNLGAITSNSDLRNDYGEV
ncbi:MAG: putative sugar nucleotidyl transferase, partial [Isosphaeraceae bacterium]|nr:putative sugar nucleotidyl transferase [Isosphaeraceae bacterium]